MTLSLANLSTTQKTRKRRGRGNASGLGTFSGRGIKGQKSRSGGKFKGGHGGKRAPRFIQTTPKKRGFRSLREKFSVVNIADLDREFQDGERVTPAILFYKGLISNPRFGVKILGDGKLTKKLTVSAQKFSGTAKDAILHVGGSVVELRETEKEHTSNK